MGALSIVLQTVGAWGRYRQRENEAFEGAPTDFNQLIQTFMASGGFSASGQYWLLVLSATALEMSLGTDGKLPDSPEAFLAMKKPAFAKIRKIAQLRLLAWAYRAAEAGQARGAEGVFKLTAETPSENRAQAELLTAQAAVEAAAPGWHYHDGTLSQFDLFLTDYVLWVDGHTGGNRSFAALKRAMDAFADQAQSPEETELAGAFRAFNWWAFKEKAQTLRIVARSDIEHWLARNRADLGKDADAAREELLRRHGFGNLALINESDNCLSACLIRRLNSFGSPYSVKRFRIWTGSMLKDSQSSGLPTSANFLSGDALRRQTSAAALRQIRCPASD